MSTKSLALRGVILNWLGRICGFLITFILTPIIIHGLGNESYGIWSIIVSFASYYAIADFGLRAGTVKYIAQYAAKNDATMVHRLISTATAIYCGLGLSIIIVAVGISYIFPLLFEFELVSNIEVRLAVIFSGCTIALRMAGQGFDAAIRGHNRFDVSNAISVLAQSVQCVVLITVVRLDYGLVGMAVSITIIAFGNQLLKYVAVRRCVSGYRFRVSDIAKSTASILVKFGALNFARQSLRRLTVFSGPVIIGMVVSPAAVTFYSIAESLTRKLSMLFSSVSSVALPVASQLESEGKSKELQQMFIELPKYMLAIAISIATILIVFGKHIIGLWIGEEYAVQAYPILCVLAAELCTRKVSGGLRAILTGTGHMRLLILFNALNCACVVSLSFILLHLWGLVGIAWARLIPGIFISGVLVPLVCCRINEYSSFDYYRKTLIPSVCSAILPIVVAITFIVYFEPNDLIVLLAEIAVVLFVSAVSIVVVCVKPERRSDIIAAFRPAAAKP